MARLKLMIDELEVETFETARDGTGRGTVRGHDSGTDDLECQANTWGGNGCDSTQLQFQCTCSGGGVNNSTCNASCAPTCNYNGGDTCYYGCPGYVGPTDPGYQGCN